MRKRATLAAAVMCTLVSMNAWASSPLPTFDKEAVTERPYNRTGQQEVITDKTNAGEYQPGNTGTEADPAFYIRQIKLTGEPLPDKTGRLAEILAAYTHRSVKVSELALLTSQITEYCKSYGYTVPQAIIPQQEIEGGVLEVRVYLAAFDKVDITANGSEVADRVLADYITGLKPGEIMTDKKLESALNNLNDLPGVVACAVLKPGTKPATTSVDVEIAHRPMWNNYVFIDNGGGYYSGRYRYGVNMELNNPGHQGDKLTVNGMMSSHDMDNYGVRYEAPVGSRGTRIGVAYSKSSYEMYPNNILTFGESEGISVYGMTPVYRDKSNRITAIYGYDRREITDEQKFDFLGLIPLHFKTEKTADVLHAGISGSQYNVNQFTQYSMIYWYGDVDTDGGAYYDGAYHKLTGDVLNIWYDGRFNYRINAHGQLANRALDGSEQFYLGGMNGVRAYGSSDGYGDVGYLATGEVRYQTDVPGLELAAFIDTGAVKSKYDGSMEHLSGWGLGLRYAKDNDWFAQLDYARKIDGRKDAVEPRDHDDRWWFQMYKMF